MKKGIPSEEEFRRASASMRELDRGLSEVRSRLLDRFQHAGLHEMFVFFSPVTETFVAHAFYRHSQQIVESARTGVSDGIRAAVLEELERVGRGQRSELKLEIDFDSHDNVEANFGGDYFLRLR